MSRPTFLAPAVACALVIAALGCSKEEIGDLVSKAKEAATEGSAQVKDTISENVDAAQAKMKGASAEVQEQLKLAGSMKLSLGEPLETDACYVNFIPQGAGRPAVLQLQSYRSAEQESFPSIFMQARVDVGSPNELLGTTVAARLFIQRQANGPVLFSTHQEPAQLKFVGIEEKVLSAELVSASVLNTETGERVSATGSCSGVLP